MDNRKRERGAEAPAIDLQETMQKYQDARHLLAFEKRQVTRLQKEGRQAEAAAAQRRVEQFTAEANSLRAVLKDAHRRGRKLPEQRMNRAEAAQFIRA